LTKHLVFVEAKAQKQFKKTSKRDQQRIVEVLQMLEKEGLSARLDIKKLRGYRSHFRVRLGDYRIRFELSVDQTIVVYSISLREKAYE
jgi:mRNA interferase RelE/StbE